MDFGAAAPSCNRFESAGLNVQKFEGAAPKVWGATIGVQAKMQMLRGAQVLADNRAPDTQNKTHDILQWFFQSAAHARRLPVSTG